MQKTLPGFDRPVPTVRLFFALWPDDATRAQLAQWRDALHVKTGGRRMQSEDLHLTLVFLGDVSSDTIDQAVTATQGVQPRRFDLCVDLPAYWAHNRIAWAGPQRLPIALKELVCDLRHALDSARLRFDRKAFVPHITLIRNASVDFQMADLPPIEWQVDHFALLRSIAGQRPRYKIVREWICKS